MSTVLVSASALLRRVKESTGIVAVEMRKGAEAYAATKERKLTCSPGCASCCYQKIVTAVADGLSIYLYLRSEGKWTPELQAKLAADDAAMTDYDHYSWFAEKKPCSFLVETSPGLGRCSVYPVRPVACAATFSIGGDAALCSVPGGREGQFQVRLDDGAEILEYMAILQGMDDAVDGGQVFMTLPGSVLWAAAFAERRPRPRVRRVTFDRAGGPGNLQPYFDSVASHKGPPREVEASWERR